MAQEQGAPPSAAELQAFSLGKCEPQRAREIEAYLSGGPDCRSTLEAAADDALLRHLRGAGELSSADAPTTGPQGEPGAESAAPFDHPRYRLIRKLGEGGMGTVYLAEHRLMRRQVAIKVIRAGYLGNPQLVQRFRQEVEAAARLSHPHIVTAHDADEAHGTHFLVMEYVEGESLDQVLAGRGMLPVEEACAYVLQAALGLEFAHRQGMVHRDLKPHNLMRAADGTVKILDFGLARLLGGAAPEAPDTTAEGSSAVDQLTAAGVVMGTADYMAPEQARDSHAADIRADIYSLGCTLYHLLTGQVPYPGGTLREKFHRHATERPEPLSRRRADVPPGLAQVLDRMMAPRPEDRYQTPGAVAAALAPFAAPRRPRRRRWIAAALAAVLLASACAVVVTIALNRTDPTEAREQPPPPASTGPAKIEAVRRIPVSADRTFFYDTSVSKGGKYALITRDIGQGVLMDVFDAATGDKLFTRPGYMARFLGDGEEVVVMYRNYFKVYESRTSKLLRENAQPIDALSYRVAPGGRHLVTVSKTGWDLFDLTQMRSLRHWDFRTPNPNLDAMHFTADGKCLLLRPGQAGDWVVWDVEHDRAGEALAGLAGVPDVAWMCRDGTTAFVQHDGQILRVNLRTGAALGTPTATRPPNTMPGVARASDSSSGWRLSVRIEGEQIQFLAHHRLRGPEVLGVFALPDSEPRHTSLPDSRFRYAVADDDAYASVLTAHSLYILRLPTLPRKGPN
jgi:tRNA A-37 threonylcarbamoyl transferase component Bud32